MRYNKYKIKENETNTEELKWKAEEYKKKKQENKEFIAKNKGRKHCPAFGSPGRCEELFNMIRYNILSSIIGAVSTFYAMVNWNNFKDPELRNTWIPNMEFYWSLGCAFFYYIFLVKTARDYRSEVNETLYSTYFGWLPEYAGEASVRLALMICATVSTRNFFYSSIVGFSLWFLYVSHLDSLWQSIKKTNPDVLKYKRHFMKGCDDKKKNPDYPVYKNCDDQFFEPWFLRECLEQFFYSIQLVISAHFNSIEGRDSIFWYIGLVQWVFIAQQHFWGHVYYEIFLPFMPISYKLLGFISTILFYDIKISFSFIVIKFLFKQYLLLTDD